MESIDILVEEHDHILAMLEVIKAMAKEIIRTERASTDHIRQVADFIKGYADGHHHDKEEEFLFKHMVDHCGPAGVKLVKSAMLVEHDQARYHNQALLQAAEDYDQDPGPDQLVEILSHMLAYRDLLQRHISKENDIVFPFAERTLPDEVKEVNERQFRAYQDEKLQASNKYLEILSELQNTYL